MRLDKIELIEYLLEQKGFYVKHSPVNRLKGHINIRCPYCGDSKKNPHKTHANIDVNNKLFHCFRCERSGLDQLLEDFNLTEIKNILYGDTGLSSLFSFVKMFEQINFKDEKFNKSNEFKYKLINFLKMRDLMENKNSILFKKSVEYLEKRGFDVDFLRDEFDVFFVTEYVVFFERYKGRIIIPSLNRITFQSRAIFQHIKPKYFKPTGRPDDVSGRIIGNDKYLFLTEGPLDALKLCQFGYDALSLNGKGTASMEFSLYNMMLRQRILSKEKIIYFQDKEIVKNELHGILKKIMKVFDYEKELHFIDYSILDDDIGDAGDLKDRKIVKELIETALIYKPEIFRVSNTLDEIVSSLKK